MCKAKTVPKTVPFRKRTGNSIHKAMKIRFNLKTPKEKISPIRVICSWSGNEVSASTGMFVPTKLWLGNKKNGKKKQRVSDAHYDPEVNIRLSDIENILLRLSTTFSG